MANWPSKWSRTNSDLPPLNSTCRARQHLNVDGDISGHIQLMWFMNSGLYQRDSWIPGHNNFIHFSIDWKKKFLSSAVAHSSVSNICVNCNFSPIWMQPPKKLAKIIRKIPLSSSQPE